MCVFALLDAELVKHFSSCADEFVMFLPPPPPHFRYHLTVICLFLMAKQSILVRKSLIKRCEILIFNKFMSVFWYRD